MKQRLLDGQHILDAVEKEILFLWEIIQDPMDRGAW